MRYLENINGAQKKQGFTLVELLVTLIITGTLLSIAIPNFSQLIKNNRLTTQLNLLVTSLNLARNEAIKRNLNITTCRSANGTSCVANWATSQNGWIVFADANGDGTVDAGEEVLRVQGQLDAGSSLKYTRNRVRYSSQGYATGFNGTFVLCDNRANPATFAKAVILSNTGRIRIAKDSNADGTLEDGSGNNITCP